ncbi:MAG: hypothetical protein ACAI44_28220 [Candidatus Sericytochromatia bacterium]
MSHFVLRRIGKFEERHGRIPSQLAEGLKAAPVVVFTNERLAEMKQACSARGDSQRLAALETYERQLAQARRWP